MEILTVTKPYGISHQLIKFYQNLEFCSQDQQLIITNIENLEYIKNGSQKNTKENLANLIGNYLKFWVN